LLMLDKLQTKKVLYAIMLHEECRQGAHLPYLGREPVAG